MLPPVSRALARMGYNVAEEVRILGKAVDVVGARAPEPDLVTVELKLSDWKRAVRQAYVNQTFGDLAYIALHEDYAHRVDTEYLRSAGIGFISVGEDASIVMEPERRECRNAILASRLWAIVMEGT